MTRKTLPKVYRFDLRDRSFWQHCQGVVYTLALLLVLVFAWGGYPQWALADSRLEDSSGTPPPEALDSLSPTSISLDANPISSEKIRQFVSAYVQVLALLGRREAQLHAAETAAESQRLEGEIAAEAIAIIENAGLTQSEYLKLLALANTDTEFGERVATQLQEEID
ncbi:MAG: DUF4168 domain-containing protein [Cyanobacteria bacterium J055]|nr:MAG: DUF4168 domain-containing protein [Cyanobacteria bacterium J055]